MDDYVEVKYFDKVSIWHVFTATTYILQYFALILNCITEILLLSKH